jgi:hypothetical protein
MLLLMAKIIFNARSIQFQSQFLNSSPDSVNNSTTRFYYCICVDNLQYLALTGYTILQETLWWVPHQLRLGVSESLDDCTQLDDDTSRASTNISWHQQSFTFISKCGTGSCIALHACYTKWSVYAPL